MTSADVRKWLAAGRTIVNVGQLSRQALGWLSREVQAGRVEVGTSYAYPLPRRSWRKVRA